MGRNINSIPDSIPTSKQIIEKVCKDKRELLKSSLNESLKKGINIINEVQYKRWVKLLKENNIIDLSNASFSDISKDGQPFAIKKINNDTHITIFSTYSLFGRNPNGPFYKGGIVTDKGIFEAHNDRSISHNTADENNNDSILNQNETESCNITEENGNKPVIDKNKGKKEAIKKSKRPPVTYSKEALIWGKTIQKQDAQTNENILPKMDTIYTIRKGDTLWDIVKTFYPSDNKRELANIINALVKYNKVQSKLNTLDNVPVGGDGIKGDAIIIGKTIHIPTELKVLGKMINRYE